MRLAIAKRYDLTYLTFYQIRNNFLTEIDGLIDKASN